MKKIAACILLIVLQGCAATPPLNFAVPNVGMSPKKLNAELKSITVVIAQPSEQTGSIYPRMPLTPGLWKSSLENALDNMLIFQDDAVEKVNLTVKILKFQPPNIFHPAETQARYELINRKNGDIIYTQDISSTGTAPINFSLDENAPIIESVNRAVENNISQFLQALETVDLSKPMFPASSARK